MKNIEPILKTFLYYFLIIFISYTLWNKLLKIESFQINIAKTGVFSEKFTYIISYITLIIEAISILLLVFFKNKGLKYTSIMLIIFTIYISFLRILNKYEVCGCGGVLNGLSFNIHLIINISLIIITHYLTNKNAYQNEN